MKPGLALAALALVGCGAATPAPLARTEPPRVVAQPPAVPEPEPAPDPRAVVPPVVAPGVAAALEDVPPGPRVLVSARAVWLDDGASAPTLAMTLASGLSTPEQRDGANVLVLVPLREALTRFGPFGPRVLVVSGDVPFRTLAEAVATLGAAGSNVARIVVKSGERVGAIRIGIPGRTSEGRLVLNLTEVNPMARVVARGEVVTIEEDSPLVTIAVSASGYTVARRGVVYAPGCRGARAADAPSPTVALRGSAHDLEALASCLRTLRPSTPAPRLAAVTADADVPLAAVLATLATARADSAGPLWDHVFLSAGVR